MAALNVIRACALFSSASKACIEMRRKRNRIFDGVERGRLALFSLTLCEKLL